MMTRSENELKDKSEPVTYNYSDDELIFQELYLKCHTLENEKVKSLRIRENLIISNKENEIIFNRLMKIKNEFESYKSHLQKTLFNMKVSTDKQKILTRIKLDEFLKKAHGSQAHYKVSPKQYELEELLNKNRDLQEKLESQTALLKLTQQQHVKLVNFVMKTFQSKVCEFCDVVLRLKSVIK